MTVTVEYLKERFDHFNALCFGGKLPPVSIELSRARTYLGQCVCKTRRKLLGRLERYDFKLRISTRVELAQDELEDVLLHEMIHYYIGINQLKDTSAHGQLFRAKMQEINTLYGRHITISHRYTAEQRKQVTDTRRRWHVVAVVTMTDGRTGIKVLPRIEQRITRYYNMVLSSPEVAAVNLYMTDDPFFNKYPNSSALKVHYIDEAELTQHLHGSHLVTCDGTTIKVSPRKTP